MALSNAERQARWRAKRNALAKQAADPTVLAQRLDELTPETLAGMSARKLERLERAAQRAARMAREAREAVAAARRVT
jgi:hypothetical protein